MKSMNNNPWRDISLEDYENHMALGSVMQLQALNEMTAAQLQGFPCESVMILGVAGGNGLEHIRKDRHKRVYGVDVNPDYLRQALLRYPELSEVLEGICLDLRGDVSALPHTELLIANLLVEYIGYESFGRAVRQVNPRCVCCGIQINTEDGWVSDSPYLHVFDSLDRVHTQMEESTLALKMKELSYSLLSTRDYPLPNGKKLVNLTFIKD